MIIIVIIVIIAIIVIIKRYIPRVTPFNAAILISVCSACSVFFLLTSLKK
jgi:hypothetical protein